MKPDRLGKLIEAGEGVSIEFKECRTSLPKTVFETLCAFLNRFGGDIFLGVADDGSVSGIDRDYVKKIKADFVSLMNNPQKITQPCIYQSKRSKSTAKFSSMFMCQRVHKFTTPIRKFLIETKTVTLK